MSKASQILKIEEEPHDRFGMSIIGTGIYLCFGLAIVAFIIIGVLTFEKIEAKNQAKDLKIAKLKWDLGMEKCKIYNICEIQERLRAQGYEQVWHEGAWHELKVDGKWGPIMDSAYGHWCARPYFEVSK